MKQYNKFLVKNTDQFDPAFTSSFIEEVNAINEQTQDLPVLFKADMLISFMKDHSLQSDWITGNPKLTAKVTSGSLPLGNIESLFTSSLNNIVYRQQLEKYLRTRFSEVSLPA